MEGGRQNYEGRLRKGGSRKQATAPAEDQADEKPYFPFLLYWMLIS